MPRTPATASALCFLLLLSGTAACAGGGRPAPSPVPQSAPAEAPSGRIDEAFEIAPESGGEPVRGGLLGDTEYDLPVEANQWVQMELDFLVNQRHSTIDGWLRRGERYSEWVQNVFASYGIPRDLHHLAMVESGYTPTARSRAGALGMWQFMPSTGRGMGLRIDDLVDERMDPVRSTHAAARHLRDLHRTFGGDWALAAAAYNAGAGRISRGMGRFGASSFWDLAVRGDLAQETRHYVPRLYAVTIIARDPARFGFSAPPGSVRPFAYDSVRVDVPTPLSELARVAGLPASDLAALNPHLKQGMVPANYWVWTPDGTGAATQTAFDASEFRRDGGYDYYTLRRGETTDEVASAAGLPLERIRDLNLSVAVERLGRGDRVRLPAPAVRLLEQRPVARVAARTEEPSTRAARPRTRAERPDSEARPRERVAREETEDHPSRRANPAAATAREERRSAGNSHTVESGETLWGIARRFDVTVSQLREANRIDEGDAIQPGQALSIPGRASSGDSRGRESRAASPAREREQAAPEASRTSHTVRAGDTLWSIARRYERSVAAIRAANHLGEDVPIQPGQKLLIP